MNYPNTFHRFKHTPTVKTTIAFLNAFSFNFLKVVEKAAYDTDELEAAVDLISQIESALKRNEFDANPQVVSTWVSRIRHECADLPELSAILAAMFRPILDSLLSTWRPLEVHTLENTLRDLGTFTSTFMYF